MATTIAPPKPGERRKPANGAGNGNGFGDFGGGGDRWESAPWSVPARAYHTGMWMGIAGIVMIFAAFTSALIVRQGTAPLVHITLPPVLNLNTLLIIASSITLEIARRRIATFMGGVRDQAASPARWLYITLFLGLLFVAGQTFAWIQLKSHGFGLATNISYSFFYVLTVAHALHVFGGLGGLVRVIGKLHKSVLRRSTLVATSRYWHFMGVLWVYLLLLLWMKL